jgi:hypothetical protein
VKDSCAGWATAGCPIRPNSRRSIVCRSVAVPTVERLLPPIRSWPTTIAADRLLSESTSGGGMLGRKFCTNAVCVSLSSRWDSAAMVPKTSDDLPEPETPVKTVIFFLGMSRETFLRLFSRAPRTSMLVTHLVTHERPTSHRSGLASRRDQRVEVIAAAAAAAATAPG